MTNFIELSFDSGVNNHGEFTYADVVTLKKNGGEFRGKSD